MARKNRKKKQVNSFVLPVPFAGIVILIVVFALVYVWLGSRCEALGRDLKKLEQDNALLEKEYTNEMCLWARKKSPASIERALKKWDIVMCWPRRDQIVWLVREDLPKNQFALAGTTGSRSSSPSELGAVAYLGTVMNE